MKSPAAEHKHKKAALHDEENADIRQLLCRLVRYATQHVSAIPSRETAHDEHKTGGDEQEILLDEEIDGIRYRLIRSQPKPAYPPVLLSPREQEIARMVAKGHPNKVIAAVLDISQWTVCTHLRRIFAKLGVSSRAAMVAQLMEESSGVERFGHAPPALPPAYRYDRADGIMSHTHRSTHGPDRRASPV